MPNGTNAAKIEREREAQKTRDAMEIVTQVVERRQTAAQELCNLYLVGGQAKGNKGRIEAEFKRRMGLALEGKLIFGSKGRQTPRLMSTPEGDLLAVLSWIGRHGLGTVENVMERFNLSLRDASRALDEAFDRKLLTMAGTLRREEEVYIATAAGLKIVGLSNLSVSPLAAKLEGHLRSCVGAAIMLEKQFGAPYKVLSERELLALNGQKKGDERLASPYYFYGKPGEETKHYKTPDLLVVLQGPHGEYLKVIAIEVELTYKGSRKLRAILRAYRGCSRIDRVEYLTSPVITSLVERDFALVEQGIEGNSEDDEAFDEAVDPDEVDALYGEDNDSAEEEPETAGQSDQPPVPVVISELKPELVPELRREPYYQPLPVLERVHDGLRRSKRDPKWMTSTRPELLAAMRWICLKGMVTADSLAIQFNKSGGCEQARALLELAEGADWLHRSELLHAEDEVFFATEAGLEQVGLPLTGLLVGYSGHRYASHYALSGSTCMRTRVAAELANEYPSLRVKTRWELRADAYFSGERMLDVSKVTKFSGEKKHADFIVMDEANPDAPYGIGLIYPYLIQLEKVKAAVNAWLVHPRCGNLLVYIGYPKLCKALEDFVAEHEQSGRVSVRPLPISEREQALRIKRSKKLTEAAEDERYASRAR